MSGMNFARKKEVLPTPDPAKRRVVLLRKIRSVTSVKSTSRPNNGSPGPRGSNPLKGLLLAVLIVLLPLLTDPAHKRLQIGHDEGDVATGEVHFFESRQGPRDGIVALVRFCRTHNHPLVHTANVPVAKAVPEKQQVLCSQQSTHMTGNDAL